MDNGLWLASQRVICLLCVLLSLVLVSPYSQAIEVSVRVSSDNDDAEERISNGDMYRDSTDLEFSHDSYVGGLQLVGMRFLGINIPQGATINSAYIEFIADGYHNNTTDLLIYGENSGDSTAFGNADDNLSDRPTTASSPIKWSPSNWRDNRAYKTSDSSGPDLSGIIQDIVDRGDWSAGNAMSILIGPDTDCTNSNCRRRAESYDGSRSRAPLLVIDYVANTSPPPTTCEEGMQNTVGIRIDNRGSDSQINTTSEALTIHAAWLAAGSPSTGLIDSGTYYVAASGLSTVDRIDFGGNDKYFSGTLPYPGIGSVGDQSFSHFLVHTSGTLSLPAGDYTIYVESDDGFSFVMDTVSGDPVSFAKFGGSAAGGSNELRYEGPTGNSKTGGSFTLTQDSVFDTAAIFFERTGGDYIEISIANDIRANQSPRFYEILRDGALGGKVKFGLCDDLTGCTASFPDALSSHNGGLLSLSTGIAINGPDNLLPFGVVSPVNNNACNGSNCAANTGASAVVLDPGMFPDTSIFTDNLIIPSNSSGSLGAAGVNQYDNVSLGNSGTLNVSTGFSEYYIDRLAVGNNATLNLQPGTYWIRSYSSGNNTNIKIAGGGTARLIFNSSVSFGNGMWANNADVSGVTGDPANLLIYGYSNITFNKNTRAWAAVYSQNNIILNKDSLYEGAWTGADITIAKNTSVSYDAAAMENIDFGSICGALCSLGSFAITQPTYGLACPNERAEINIIAMCEDGTTEKTDYVGTINLSSDENTQSDFFLNSTGGSVVNEIVLTEAEGGKVDVFLFHKNENNNLKVTAEDAVAGFLNEAINGTDFRTTGFSVSNPESFICGGTSSFTITAKGEYIEDISGSGSCNTLTGFDGTKVLKAWSDVNIDPLDPGTKDTGLPENILLNGDPVGESDTTTLNIDAVFSAGVATVSVEYPDVGEVMNVSFIHDDVHEDNTVSELAGATGLFIVSPDSVQLVADDSAASCSPASATCEKFKKANLPFSVTARAVCLAPSNSTAPSYRGVVALDHELILPLPRDGDKGMLDVKTIEFDGTSSVAGEEQESNQKISEVGVFSIKTVPPSYFREPVTTFYSENIGRFYPHHFDVSITGGEFENQCLSIFTYMDQPFHFGSAPEVTIEAQNADDEITQNYEGDFWKLGSSLQQDSSCNGGTGAIKGFCYEDVVAGDAGFISPILPEDYPSTVSTKGKVVFDLHGLISEDTEFFYSRPAVGLVVPFDADVNLDINVKDDDDIEGSINYEHIGFSGDTDPTGSDQNTNNDEFFRYGRWRMENVFGPENSSLEMSAVAEYYNISKLWQVNDDDNDSCTSLSMANATENILLSSDPIGTGSSPEEDIPVNTATTDFSYNANLMKGDGNFLFSPLSIVGKSGSVKITADLSELPWLRFDWDGNGSFENAPDASATFGRYRGHDRIIYWREVSN